MSPDLRVAALASRRHGVFTREEALAAGCTPKMVHLRLASGRWGRLHPSVYRIAGTPPSWQQALAGAWLAAGPGAVVSHGSAARLWQLPRGAGDRLEMVVAGDARRRPRAVRVHRMPGLAPVDTVERDGLVVATPTLTLIQLAGRLDRAALAVALDHCLNRHHTSPAHIRRRLVALGRQGRPGVTALDALLAERPSGTRRPDSQFEHDLLALVAQLPGPPPVPQFRVELPSGAVAFLDIAWPLDLVGMEGDSYLHHSSRIDWSRDHTRNAELTALGWKILPVTRFDLDTRPGWVLDLTWRARTGKPWSITSLCGT